MKIINKKGYYDDFKIIFFTPIVFIVLIMFLFLFAVVQIELELGKTCEYYGAQKLESFNAIKDTNTGLFSGGSVDRNTILFGNGLLIDISQKNLRDVDIIIGNNYQVYKCNAPTLNTFWEISKL